MNNNTGFFQWIREGVRRSVLLGFSDAVEQLGAPADSGDVSPHLLAALRQTSTSLPQPQDDAGPGVRSLAKPERKRLGRSLDQIRETSAKSE